MSPASHQQAPMNSFHRPEMSPLSIDNHGAHRTRVAEQKYSSATGHPMLHSNHPVTNNQIPQRSMPSNLTRLNTPPSHSTSQRNQGHASEHPAPGKLRIPSSVYQPNMSNESPISHRKNLHYSYDAQMASPSSSSASSMPMPMPTPQRTTSSASMPTLQSYTRSDRHLAPLAQPPSPSVLSTSQATPTSETPPEKNVPPNASQGHQSLPHPPHPDVVKLTNYVLDPMRKTIETLWDQSIPRVQHEVAKMHLGFTTLLEAERKKVADLTDQLDSARSSLSTLQGENDSLKRQIAEDNHLQSENQRLAAEVGRLSRQLNHVCQALAQAEAEQQNANNVIRVMREDMRAEVSHQVSQQVDQQMALYMRYASPPKNHAIADDERYGSPHSQVKDEHSNGSFDHERERRRSSGSGFLTPPSSIPRDLGPMRIDTSSTAFHEPRPVDRVPVRSAQRQRPATLSPTLPRPTTSPYQPKSSFQDETPGLHSRRMSCPTSLPSVPLQPIRVSPAAGSVQGNPQLPTPSELVPPALPPSLTRRFLQPPIRQAPEHSAGQERNGSALSDTDSVSGSPIIARERLPSPAHTKRLSDQYPPYGKDVRVTTGKMPPQRISATPQTASHPPSPVSDRSPASFRRLSIGPDSTPPPMSSSSGMAAPAPPQSPFGRHQGEVATPQISSSRKLSSPTLTPLSLPPARRPSSSPSTTKSAMSPPPQVTSNCERSSAGIRSPILEHSQSTPQATSMTVSSPPPSLLPAPAFPPRPLSLPPALSSLPPAPTTSRQPPPSLPPKPAYSSPPSAKSPSMLPAPATSVSLPSLRSPYASSSCLSPTHAPPSFLRSTTFSSTVHASATRTPSLKRSSSHMEGDANDREKSRPRMSSPAASDRGVKLESTESPVVSVAVVNAHEDETKQDRQASQAESVKAEPGEPLEEGEVSDEPPRPLPKRPEPSVPKLAFRHMDFMYEKLDRLICRFCVNRSREAKSERLPIVSYPLDASWQTLVEHSQTAHPASCKELANHSPNRLAELRQRLAPRR